MKTGEGGCLTDCYFSLIVYTQLYRTYLYNIMRNLEKQMKKVFKKQLLETSVSEPRRKTREKN